MGSKTTPNTLLEQKLWNEGLRIVCGIDEAGRGPWAGPVSAGAVVIDAEHTLIETVTDSKKMSEKQREDIFEEVKERSTGWGVGLVEAIEIDNIGIQKAVQGAMIRALKQVEEQLKNKVEYIIADGSNIMLIDGYEMDRIKKGDLLHYSIAAASILAKVTRDRIMKKHAEKYPDYGFESHVGYGTKQHREALERLGPCDIHRKSYKPIAKLL
jgi:ribonuclease HII